MVSLMNPLSEYRDFSFISGALDDSIMGECYNMSTPKVEISDDLISPYSEETNSYQGLTTVDYNNSWAYKSVCNWSYQDIYSWMYEELRLNGHDPTDFPMYLFQMTDGQTLMLMTAENFTELLLPKYMDKGIAMSLGHTLHESLQKRIAETQPYYPEESIVPESVLEKSNNNESLHASDDNTQSYVNLDADHKFLKTEFDYGHDINSWEYSSKTSLESDNEESMTIRVFKPVKRPPGRPRGSGRKEQIEKKKNVSVPEFLRDLLFDSTTCPSIIRWEDYQIGKFRFVQPNQVAALWGDKKGNKKMSFEKFSRAMRYHYKQGVLQSVPTARLVYQFGPKGPNYRTTSPILEQSYTNGS